MSMNYYFQLLFNTTEDCLFSANISDFDKVKKCCQDSENICLKAEGKT